MRLLDSDTLSHLWANHQRVVERLAQCDDTEIGITSITKSEILRARCENLLKAATAKELLRAQQRLDQSERMLADLTVAPFDDAAANKFNELSKRKSLKKIGRADLLISCFCLANEATLVTRNQRHFRQVPNLNIENWVD